MTSADLHDFIRRHIPPSTSCRLSLSLEFNIGQDIGSYEKDGFVKEAFDCSFSSFGSVFDGTGACESFGAILGAVALRVSISVTTGVAGTTLSVGIGISIGICIRIRTRSSLTDIRSFVMLKCSYRHR